MAKVKRNPGFLHLQGAFHATVLVMHVDVARVAKWLPPGVSLAFPGVAPEGTHPVALYFLGGEDVGLSAIPLFRTQFSALVLSVLGVRAEGARFPGPYAYTVAWWAEPRLLPRLGGRLFGLPPRPEPLEMTPQRRNFSVGVPGQVKLSVEDHGELPDWPNLKKVCLQLQQPLLCSRGGRLRGAGLYLNLGDADMRVCTTTATIEAAALPGEDPGGPPLVVKATGTADLQIGGALRLGSLWTLSRARSLQFDWAPWKVSANMRLSADLAPLAVGRARPPSSIITDAEP